MILFNFKRKSYSDAEIVTGHQRGDRDVQCYWYGKCRSQFDKGTSRYSHISDDDKADLFQDAYILLLEKIETHQMRVSTDGAVVTIGRNGEALVADLIGYFMRIVKNKYLEYLRSHAVQAHIIEAITPDHEGLLDDIGAGDDAETQRLRLVSYALRSLPKSCIEILTLFYYEKKSLDEILALRPENTSYDGLKSRKSKCMSNLKTRIAESFDKLGLS